MSSTAPREEGVCQSRAPAKKEFVIGGAAPKKEDPAPPPPAPEKEMEKLKVTDKPTKPPVVEPEPEPEEIVPVADDEDDATFDPREHLNLVFIGHVDAGKSTIGGQILFQAGMVDDRTIEKYGEGRQGEEPRELVHAYIMDTSEEERAKGKTVEVGRALRDGEEAVHRADAPGHKKTCPT